MRADDGGGANPASRARRMAPSSGKALERAPLPHALQHASTATDLRASSGAEHVIDTVL